MKHLLIFDALHGGSHAAWSSGLAAALPEVGWNAQLVALPGRHWKWRMEGAAWWFAQEIRRAHLAPPDALLVTDMVDVARLRGTLPPEWRHVPIACYFHENQLTFPWKNDELALQQTGYAFINALSAWAADAIWFNSAHHRTVFLSALPELLSRFPDASIACDAGPIEAKSSVIPPGLSLPNLPNEVLDRPLNAPPVLVWNHRWAYDKHPEFFVETAEALLEGQNPFSVDLLGRGDREAPSALQAMCTSGRFAIRGMDSAPDVASYWHRLMTSDVLVHSPLQEYFGMSVIEALHAGVLPILPNEHAYPEYASEFRTVRSPQQAAQAVASITSAPIEAVRGWRHAAHRAAAPFSWLRMAPRYAQALDEMVAAQNPSA